MKRVLVASILALAASACASDRVDFGGIANPLELTGRTVDCQTAGVVMTQRGPVTYPNSLLSRAYYAQSRDGFRVVVPFTFDVSRTGDVVNLQFSGNQDMTRDGAERDAILFASESLLESEFEWTNPVDAQYATGCENSVTFSSRLIDGP